MNEKVSSLKHGIETSITRMLDSDGSDMSGGERQKLVIARALYKKAPVCIFDEPTSALSATSEYEIYKSFSNLTDNKTVFYISHRLSVAKYADKVIFIDQNGVSGFDTHDNLMNSCARYRDMYETQAKHYR